MKKILMVGNTDFSIYIYRKELVQRLLDEGFKVYISSPHGDRVQSMIDMGCEFVESDLSAYGLNPINEFLLLYHYYKIINRINPDIVLTYTIKPNIYIGFVSRLTKTPFIPNITGLGTAIAHNGMLQKFTLFLLRIALKDAKIVFLQNQDNMEYILNNNIGNGKEFLLPGSGVNLSEHIFKPYPNKSEPIQFSFISRLKREKGIDYFLELANYFQNKNYLFNVAGFDANDYYEELLQDYHSRGIIKYYGKLLDIRSLMGLTHCVIHPTYYPEGISNILLESAASGRPIITTDRPGCKEVINDGVNGFIVKTKNTQDLIEKTETFINLSYEEKVEMGKAGRKKVEEEFSREIVTNIYMDEVKKMHEIKR